jgi:hypothetical protein
MPDYCVDNQPRADGGHEVHNVWLGRCDRLPPVERRVDVGYFTSGHPAIERARKTHATAVGCSVCCPECQGVVTVDARPVRRKAPPPRPQASQP